MRDMIGVAFALVAITGTVWADEHDVQDRLATITTYFAEADVISGPELLSLPKKRPSFVVAAILPDFSST